MQGSTRSHTSPPSFPAPVADNPEDREDLGMTLAADLIVALRHPPDVLGIRAALAAMDAAGMDSRAEYDALTSRRALGSPAPLYEDVAPA